MMKTAIVPEKNRIEIADISIPRPGAYDCLVKIDACAICTGTDSNIVGGKFAWPQPYPFALGHESTGIIIEVGDKVRAFQVGQRVTRPAAVFAGEQRAGLGSQWGGYAEYGLVRDVTTAIEDGLKANGMLNISRVPLPDGIDPISAALSVNQREILSVVRRITLNEQSAVVVIGSGYNGLLFSLFSKHFGAGYVLVMGNPVFADLATSRYKADFFVDYRDPTVLEQCRKNLPSPVTHVIDAIGTVESVEFAQKLLSAGTAIGYYGVHNFHETASTRETIGRSHPHINMTTDEPGTVGEWYMLWQSGFFDGTFDRSMPFAQINEAFDILARREALKLVLEMG